MAKLNDLIVTIGAQTKQFDKALGASMSKMRNFGRSTKRLGKSMTMNLTAPIAALGFTAVKAFDQQAKAIAQVEAGLKSTGASVGFTSKQLQKMASDLQSKTLFGDEEILKDATAQLLTFTNITGDQFAKSQEAALNLATRLDGDLKSASIMLGKALNDPVANLSAMSRAGIQFSEDQKEVIKALAESGDMAQAQSIILEELEKQYGGSAEAAAKAGTGGLKQLANAFGDLQEEFGKVIMDFMPPVIDGLKNMLAAFQNLSPQAKRFMVIGAGIAAALGPLLVILPSIIQGFMMLMSPISLVIGAIVGLGIAIVTFADEIAPYITGVINFFITLYNESSAVRTIIGLIKGTVITVFDFFAFAVNNVIASFRDLGSIIKAVMERRFGDIPALVGKAFTDAAERTAEFGRKAAENYTEAVNEELGREPLELVTDESVANAIRNLGGLREYIANLMSGGGGGTIETPQVGDLLAGLGAGTTAPTVEGELNIVDIDMPEDVVEEEDIDAVIAASTAVQNRVNAMAQSVAGFVDSAFQQIASGTATFEQVMLDMIKRLALQLASLIAQFMILSVLFPSASMVKGGLGKFIGSGFGLPMMANGGLFTGASLAMVGEGSGTSSINPEVVAPLDRLQEMMGATQVQVTGRISGRDILLTSERNAIDRNRVRGF
jgi:hypothetical protein